MSIADQYARSRALAVEYPLAVITAIVGVVLLVDLVMQVANGELGIALLGGYIWSGLMQGLIVGLAGIGLSMTYSILNFANFGHGDYITAGAFTGWGVSYLVAGLGSFGAGGLLLVGIGSEATGPGLNLNILQTPLAIVLGLVASVLATVAVALIVDRVVYKPMRDAGGIPLLIASVGVAFALRYLVVFVYKAPSRGTTYPAGIPSLQLFLLDGTVKVDAHDGALVVIAVGLMVALHFFLQGTKLGKAMRAMSDNKDLALVTGIPTERVVTWTWIIGSGLAGAAGYLTVLWRGTINFQLGWLLLLLIFAAVILGGIGSVYGSIVGGLVIGLTMRVSLVWLPADFMRVSAFAIMILVLLLRPQGIYGGRTTA